MSDPQNIYDRPEFHTAYQRLRYAPTSLNELLEQPALLAELPRSLTGLKVLDLGCGFGDFARKARKLGARSVLGIDISTRMLTYAAANTSDPAIEYRCGDIGRLDLEPTLPLFDLVVSSLALHYVSDYAATAARVANLLVKGGRFVFSVEHPLCTAVARLAWEHDEWVRDADGRALYWPIDNYSAQGPRSNKWLTANDLVIYHRTVATYINGLIQAGLTLRSLREPEPLQVASAETSPYLELDRRRPPVLLMAATRD